MQYFIDTATGKPFAFDDNVTATNTNGVYSFTYTTGVREPDVVTPATYAPDTTAADGTVTKGEMLTPETSTPGALIVFALPVIPTTLQACTEEQATAAANPPPTAAQVVAANTAQQAALSATASAALAPLQTALMLGIATDAEKASATAWVGYSRDLQAVDLTQAAPAWPAVPAAA
jgi:hypothetical protein